MKIGLISDTHGFLDPAVEKIFAGVKHILHAGDVGDPIIPLELEFTAPTTTVLGNNDLGMNFRETEVITLAEKKFLIHHIVNPFALSDQLALRIKRERPDAVIFGHTHKGFCELVDGILYFNPGYSGAKKFGADRSVAIFQVDDRGITPEFVPLP